MAPSKLTIIYVDDEEINLRLFKNTFRRNYNVLTAASGKECLEIIASKKFDIVITDQRMPNMTGIELLANIQELFPNVPPSRLMISGYSETKVIKEAYDKYNLFKFISKPWEEDMLINIFNKLLKVA